MRNQMTKRVWIGVAIVLGIALAALLWAVIFHQKIPMEGTLV